MCLHYRALAYLITGHQTGHLAFRQKICKFIMDHNTYLNEDGEKYLMRTGMKRHRVWATDQEIWATAQLFKCDIYVWHPLGKKGLQWLRYPCRGEEKYSHSIYLDNNSASHYNAVIKIK